MSKVLIRTVIYLDLKPSLAVKVDAVCNALGVSAVKLTKQALKEHIKRHKIREPKMQMQLFKALAHGDAKHQEWLKKAIDEFFKLKCN